MTPDQLAARLENLELAVETLLAYMALLPNFDRRLADEALSSFRGVLADLKDDAERRRS